MKKIVILVGLGCFILGVSLMFFFTSITNKTVSAQIFDKEIKIDTNSNKDIVEVINKNISLYKPINDNVKETSFVITINGIIEDDYENYDEPIKTVSVDVFDVVEIIEKEEIPFDTIKQEDYTKLRGVEIVKVEGVEGSKTVTKTVVYKNGIEYEEVSKTEDIVDAVDEVIAVGMLDQSENGNVSGLTGQYANIVQCENRLAEITKENEVSGIQTEYICVKDQSDDGSYNLKLVQ